MKELKNKLENINKKKEENNIYKSNDLERIIKEHKNERNKIEIKKPESDINTIFNYIENDYNISEEENNSNNINNDKNFSFKKRLTGTFGQDNSKNNEEDIKFSFNPEINEKDNEKDSKFNFQINSDINESEFNDINYL